jgi:uroporphyrinogen-III synthase
MGTGRALVWYSPKSYPNQTHIRELKEKKIIIIIIKSSSQCNLFLQVFFLSKGGLLSN